MGLVEARVVGARAAEGDVIVILDAHCECVSDVLLSTSLTLRCSLFVQVTNWLPPLLTRIALNRKTLAVPIVDGIEWNTLQHNTAYGGTLYRGIWEWGFLYKESELPQRDRALMKYPTEPYRSPTVMVQRDISDLLSLCIVLPSQHAGGLLAIDKEWFFQLGGYDPDIKIW